ncbi:MAG: hypothetical protein NTW06_00300, partial [Candidatus Falkowbacteria bacterium]|nr:hypothetical protein [Candidatus Falkowbacteria bacterium]
MINRKLIVVVICFIISFFSFWPAKAQNIPAPIIDNAQFNEIAKVWIINGTTAEDTEVMLFLDSKFIGLALIKNNGNKKIFCYSLGKSLTIGKHNFTALARDKNSYLTSVYSQQFSIDIEPDQKSKTAVVRTGDTLVAPIIITPLTILVFGQNKPLIIGLANVGDMVEVYFDGRLDGKTAKLAGATGIASFAYLPSQELAIGEHTLYVKAINQQGQDNGQSDGISFSVEQKLPAPILNELLIKNSAGQLVLTGLVKNNLIVNIYLDEKK